jgi:hypothetical protein
LGQEAVYALAQAVILEMEQWDAYPNEYRDKVAEHVAHLMAAALWPNGHEPLVRDQVDSRGGLQGWDERREELREKEE